MSESRDPHQYGDFALTKFYDFDNDIGLADLWQNIQDILRGELDDADSIILGEAFGPSNNYFDPGKMGSYFQSPTQVKKNLAVVRELLSRKPELTESLSPVVEMLQGTAQHGKGLYVTF